MAIGTNDEVIMIPNVLDKLANKFLNSSKKLEWFFNTPVEIEAIKKQSAKDLIIENIPSILNRGLYQK